MTNIKEYFTENKIVTNYTLFLVITIFFLWIINYFNISYPLTITQKQASGELAVVGVGKVDIVPDAASVDLSIIVNDAKSMDEAQNKINTINNSIVESVKQLGIESGNIKTSNYSITPNYDYSKGRIGIITGYNGNVTITIKVTDTTKLPQVIEAGTKAGANQVMGTNYMVDKPEKYQEQARQKAINNAKDQAQKLASQLGIKLGKVTNIVESTYNPVPMPITYSKEAMGMSGGISAPAPDLQPGTQTITSTVTLYFEKK